MLQVTCRSLTTFFPSLGRELKGLLMCWMQILNHCLAKHQKQRLWCWSTDTAVPHTNRWSSCPISVAHQSNQTSLHTSTDSAELSPAPCCWVQISWPGKELQVTVQGSTVPAQEETPTPFSSSFHTQASTLTFPFLRVYIVKWWQTTT